MLNSKKTILYILTFLIFWSLGSEANELELKDVLLPDPLTNLVDYEVSEDGSRLFIVSGSSTNRVAVSVVNIEESELSLQHSYRLPTDSKGARQLLLFDNEQFLLILTDTHITVLDISNIEIEFKPIAHYDLTQSTWQQITLPIIDLAMNDFKNRLVGLGKNGLLFSINTSDKSAFQLDNIFYNEEFSDNYAPNSLSLSVNGNKIITGNAPDVLVENWDFTGTYPYFTWSGQDSERGILSQFNLSDTGVISLDTHLAGSDIYSADASSISSVIVRDDYIFAHDVGEGNVLVFQYINDILTLKQVISENVFKGQSIGRYIAVSQDLKQIAISGLFEGAHIFSLDIESQMYQYTGKYNAPIRQVGQICDCAYEHGLPSKIVFVPGQDALIKRQEDKGTSFPNQLSLIKPSGGIRIEPEWSNLGEVIPSPHMIPNIIKGNDGDFPFLRGLSIDNNEKLKLKEKYRSSGPLGNFINVEVSKENALFVVDEEYIGLKKHIYEGDTFTTSCTVSELRINNKNYALNSTGDLVFILDANQLQLSVFNVSKELSVCAEMVSHNEIPSEINLLFGSSLYIVEGIIVIKHPSQSFMHLLQYNSEDKAVEYLSKLSYEELSFSPEEKIWIFEEPEKKRLHLISEYSGVRILSATMNGLELTHTLPPFSEEKLSGITATVSNNTKTLFINAYSDTRKYRLLFNIKDDLIALENDFSTVLTDYNYSDVLTQDGQYLISKTDNRDVALFKVQYTPEFSATIPYIVYPINIPIDIQLTEYFNDRNTNDVLTFINNNPIPGLTVEGGNLRVLLGSNEEHQINITATDTAGLQVVGVLKLKANSEPVVTDISIELEEDLDINLILNATDPDEDELSYELIENPSHGSITGETPNLVYTPDENYFGSDQLTFVAKDSYESSISATIYLNIIAVNDAPVAQPDSASVGLNDISIDINVLGNDYDVDGDDLTVLAASVTQGNLAILDNQQIRYTAPNNFLGEVTITYTIGDNAGGEDSSEVLVSIDTQNKDFNSGGSGVLGSIYMLLILLLTSRTQRSRSLNGYDK